MMRSISWCEMSILNESSMALPYVSAFAVARSGATIVSDTTRRRDSASEPMKVSAADNEN